MAVQSYNNGHFTPRLQLENLIRMLSTEETYTLLPRMWQCGVEPTLSKLFTNQGKMNLIALPRNPNSSTPPKTLGH